ncbi:MAG: acyl carrier protein [Lachnospiraceae bacterium]|nr:acyl carrier protein [Lachnospiraceae bacterium]
MSAIEKICEILRDFFDDDSIVIDETSAAKDVDGWDSLANVQIMLSIEEEFGVNFDLDDMVKFKCIGDIVECIERKSK